VTVKLQHRSALGISFLPRSAARAKRGEVEVPMKALFVTGQPSCGKTTIVKRLVELANEQSTLPISGFVDRQA
jgi:energy-coupling factor transporter ATP-binding protein EcfA2